MKQFVRIASFITAIIMFFVPVLNASAVTIDSTQTPLNEIDAQFFTTQASSIKKYNDILNAFSASAQMLSDQKTSSKTVYPDNYGGAYIDSNSGKLVIMVANDTVEQFVSNYTVLQDDSLLYEICEVSYNEINAAIAKISKNIPLLQQQGIIVTSVYDDIINNRVVVKVVGLTPTKETAIKNIVSVNYVSVQESEDISLDVSIGGGISIKSSINEYSTLGFPATRNGVSGFVIAGHAATTSGISFTYASDYSNITVGTSVVSAYYRGSTADAAFISAASGITPTNYLASLNGYIWDASTMSYPVNTTVIMLGATTGYSTGKILGNNASVTVNNITINNQYMTDYTSAGGDSGAPILIYDGYYQGYQQYTLIGIHSAHEGRYCSYYTPYANIVSSLNVQCITN